MATEKPRFSVTFTDETFSKIQQYQKENNISTQSKAVAHLVELALNQLELENSAKKAPLYSSEAEKLARDYDTLDSYGKKLVRLVTDAEKARFATQAQAAPVTTKLYIAARDGSRMEVEVDDDFTLPDESATIPE